MRGEDLVVDAIPTPNGPVILTEPMTITPSFTHNLVTFEHEALGIVAYGETREEAEVAFHEELAWLWTTYATAPDDGLADDAQRLKKTLLALVEELQD